MKIELDQHEIQMIFLALVFLSDLERDGCMPPKEIIKYHSLKEKIRLLIDLEYNFNDNK